MKLTVKYINPKYIVQSWDVIAPFLRKSEVFGSGVCTLDQTKVYAILGQRTILVAVDDNEVVHGAMVVVFSDHPNDRVAFIESFGGRLVSDNTTFDQLKAYFVSQGATKMQGYVRPSMARFSKKLGFNEKATLMEASL